MKIKINPDNNKMMQCSEAIEKNGRICPIAHTYCICEEFLSNPELGPCKYGLYVKEEV